MCYEVGKAMGRERRGDNIEYKYESKVFGRSRINESRGRNPVEILYRVIIKSRL